MLGTRLAVDTGASLEVPVLTVGALVAGILNAFVRGGIEGVALETGATDVALANLTSGLGTILTQILSVLILTITTFHCLSLASPARQRSGTGLARA